MSAWPDTLHELLARAAKKLTADESSRLAWPLSKHVARCKIIHRLGKDLHHSTLTEPHVI